jgi:hypothetical protein
MDSLAKNLNEMLYQHPNEIFKDGEIRIKRLTFSDEGGEVHIALASSLTTLVKQITKYFEQEQKEVEEKIMRKIEEFEKMEKAYNEAIEENQKYKEWYGDIISPILMLREMWNNGKLGRFSTLIPHTRWKIKGIEEEGGRKAIMYWISMFEELKLIRTYGKGRYLALMGLYEAIEIITTFKSKKQKDK